MDVRPPDVTPQEALPALLDAYRRRIRRARLFQAGGLAATVVGLIWALGAAYHRLNAAHPDLLGLCMGLSIAVCAVALLVGLTGRPSLARTAGILDRRLDNQQRIVTALELAPEPHLSEIPQTQVATTAYILAEADPQRLYPVRAPKRQFVLGTVLLAVALAVLLLPGLGQSGTPTAEANGPLGPGTTQANGTPTTSTTGTPFAQQTGAAETPTETAQAEATRQMEGPSATQTSTASQAEAEAKAQQSDQAQKDLNKLADELSDQSAAQSAADSLHQGKYDDAANQLADLGKQNDQLSDAAKQALSDALKSAAQDTQSNDLQQAEQNAADALKKGDYKDIADALQSLSDAVKRAGGDVIPQQQLAKDFPQPTVAAGAQAPQQAAPSDGSRGGQGQQGDNSQSQQGSGQSGQSSNGGQQGQAGDGSQNQNQGQQGAGQGAGQDGQQGAGQGQQGQGGGQDNGQQGGQAGAPGDGHRVSGPVDPSQPNGSSNPFELDAKPGLGNTPQDNHPAMTLDTKGSSGGATAPSQGGKNSTQGESNSLPVERWGVVQHYFDSSEK